jgi:hypothetical protein
MAYASAVALTVQEISRAGKSVTEQLVAPTATHGNKFRNDGKTFLRVKNGSASPITVTIDTPGSVDGQALADLTVTVKATGDTDGLDFVDIGPFTATFNQADGYVWAVCSAVTTVEVGAYHLANP